MQHCLEQVWTHRIFSINISCCGGLKKEKKDKEIMKDSNDLAHHLLWYITASFLFLFGGYDTSHRNHVASLFL